MFLPSIPAMHVLPYVSVKMSALLVAEIKMSGVEGGKQEQAAIAATDGADRDTTICKLVSW